MTNLNRLAATRKRRQSGSTPSSFTILATELVDATAGIDDLLLAGVKRMTGGANLDQRSSPSVERVVNSFPQLQVTLMSP